MDAPTQRAFHHEFYASNVWAETRWLGVPVRKCPMDLWMYQQVIYSVAPDLIVECGTAFGGSAYYLASLCDLLGHGRIVTIDIEPLPFGRPQHPRITYLLGSSTAPGIVEQIRALAVGKPSVLVVLDSDHRAEHVAAELGAYAPLVTPGSYCIVEDTNVNGHPVEPAFGPGPAEAVDAFLAKTADFRRDVDCEKFFLTFNPGGYLRRV